MGLGLSHIIRKKSEKEAAKKEKALKHNLHDMDAHVQENTQSYGTPPQRGDSFHNLQQPEVAPYPDYIQVDRRTLRKTGRTEQFNTRVKEGFRQKVRQLAARDGISMAEVIELSVEMYRKA